jgi:transposase
MGFSGLPASLGEQTETSHGHRLAQALGSRSKESQPLVKFLNAPRNRLCETWKELTKTGEPGKKGKPKFKKKGVADSFYLEGSIRISGDRIKVPILGWLKCAEILPSVTPKNVTISCQARRWYISFKVEVPEGQVQPTSPPPDARENQAYRRLQRRLERLHRRASEPQEGEVVAVDLGINRLATCWQGVCERKTVPEGEKTAGAVTAAGE